MLYKYYDFLKQTKMIYEKKLLVGISIVDCLIDAYDDSTKDSAINDIAVINYCKNNSKIIISKIDFEEIVDLLNKACTIKDFINKHVFCLVSWDRVISTKCRKEYLIDVKRQLEEELDKVSILY